MGAPQPLVAFGAHDSMNAARVLRPSLPRAVVLGVLLGTTALNGMASMHVRAIARKLAAAGCARPWAAGLG